jgi:hypothetical protein
MASRQPENIHAIFNELETANDRAAAIVATSLLEHAIQEALQSFDSNEDFERLGLSSKITKAYALKIIGPTTRHDLDLIRAIRNEFAHDMNPIQFTDEHITSCYKEVKRDNDIHMDGKSIRDRFIRLVELYTSALMFQSQVGLEFVKHLAQPDEDRLLEIKSSDSGAAAFVVMILE